MKNVCYINAGAGSGKTYRLTQELKTLLLEKNIKPSQVILTTFTELAASEFKEKACSALLDKDCPKEERQRRIAISVAMGSAAIGTVHSIAFKFIQKYWYSLQYGDDINVMSEDNEKIYTSESLANILTDGDIALFDKFSSDFGLENIDGKAPLWKEYLSDVIEKMNYYNVNRLDESIERSLRSVRSIMCGREWNVASKNTYDALFKKYSGIVENQKNLEAIAENTEYDKCYRQLITLHNKIFDKKIKKFYDKLSEQEKEDWDNFAQYLNSRTYLPQIEEFLKRIFEVARRWNTEYKKYKQNHNVISFNDMELLFLEMLKHDEALRKDISTNYKVLMVDEFQDSNPIQLRIFNELSELIALNGGRSIWVGDPKQAIYGFRGADTDLVTSVARIFDDKNNKDGLTSDILTESWRSRQPLVELSNCVFSKIFTPEEIPNREHIKLKPHYNDDLNEKALSYWNISYGNKTELLSALAYKVKELTDKQIKVKPKNRGDKERCIKYSDIAILVYDNDSADELSKVLRRIGLPVSTPEKNIMQRREVQLVRAILTYFVENYSAHVKADIINLAEGETTENIIKDRLDYLSRKGEDEADEWKNDDEFLNLVENLRQRTNLMSVKDIVSAVIYELNICSIAARWNDIDIRRQNLNTLIDIARKYEDSCVTMGLGATVAGFLNYMNDVQIEISADNTSDTIKVMTYHKSKGLEWPVVILMSLDSHINAVQELIKKQFMGVEEVRLNNTEDTFDCSYYIHFFPSIFYGKVKIPEYMENRIIQNDIYKRQASKALSESKRVLYVGMTRARDYLIAVSGKNESLTFLESVGIKPEKEQQDGEVHIWGSDAPGAVKINVDGKNIACMPAPQSDSYMYLNKPLVRSERRDKFLSPSLLPLSEDDDAVIRIKQGIGNGISREGWKDMAAVGTCIHNIFAVYRHGNKGNETTASRIISRHGLEKELGNHAKEIITSADALYDYLTNTYGKAEHADREMPFYHECDGQIVNGEMDLVWNYVKDGHKCCVLVDYKSFPGRSDEVEAHTVKYIPQLRAYKSALNDAHRNVTDCIIYYAVQGCVAEVKL